MTESKDGWNYLEANAYHEAGHAIVGWALGGRVLEIKICDDRPGEHAQTEVPEDLRLIDRVAILNAGHEAEVVLGGAIDGMPPHGWRRIQAVRGRDQGLNAWTSRSCFLNTFLAGAQPSAIHPSISCISRISLAASRFSVFVRSPLLAQSGKKWPASGQRRRVGSPGM